MKKSNCLVLFIGLMGALCFNSIQAQNLQKAKVTKAVFLGKTKAYNEVQAVEILPNNDKKSSKKANFPRLVDNFHGAHPMPVVNLNALPNGPDPLRQIGNQLKSENGLEIEVGVNIEGINAQQSGSIPPDPVGFVNEDYYVQMTNAAGGAVIYVLDKEGNTLAEPMSMAFIWTQLNTSTAGDPIILWDQEAERWVVCELGANFTSFVFAVSATSDPLGAYYAYQVFTPNLEIPDYPKFGIWNDAYYLTTNEPSEPNIPVYVFEREAALSGAPNLQVQILGVPKFDIDAPIFEVTSAADWDGILPPPTGSPQYLLRIQDDAWGFGVDRIEIWEASIDFDDPDNSSLTGPINLPTAPFDATLCDDGNIFACVDQGNGEAISALEHVIMFRTQYRNFGTHEAMVLNFSVDVTGDNQAGIRWMELRKMPGEQWSIYQEGTYAPDDLHRFMASIAMDGAGNIALGYSVMGPGKFPSLRVTGRRHNDPLGEMTFEEFELATGEGWNQFGRWGDYSAMSVDPVDERTFWFTGEYMPGVGNWGTKILCFTLGRDTVDMAATAVVQPQNSAFLSDAETVTATFTNLGLEAQSNFEVGYMLDGNLLETVTVNQTVQPDSNIDVTFNNTADLSIIKDYDFKVFVALAEDQIVFNDTFRTTITKLPRFDAAITAFPGTEAPICDANSQIGIELTNFGGVPLTSVDIIWSYNSGTEQTINWTGNLAANATEVINVGVSDLLNGSNSIAARTENPNGMVDENTDNDALSRNFNTFLDDPKFLSLEIDFDNVPTEVTWTLTNESNAIIYSGGPYSSSQAGTQIVEELCIVEGCYTFTMFDAGNDGLCCNFGEGSYRLLDENEVFMAQGDNYGSQEVTNFCLPFVCFLGTNISVVNETAPGEENGLIFISVTNAINPVMYSIDGGQTFSDSGLFQNLPGGIYEVLVADGMNCQVNQTVLVGTCNVEFNVEVIGVSSIGAADGSITINPTSGIPPFLYSIEGVALQQTDPFFPGLAEGEYFIEIADSIGCKKTLSVSVGLGTDVKELGTEHYAVRISPNPTEGLFLVQLEGITDVWMMEMELLDAAGKVVQRGTLTRYDDTFGGKLSLYLYPAGVYYVRILHPQVQEMYRIVRQ